MTIRIRSLSASAACALLLSPVAAFGLQSQAEQTQQQQLRAQQQPPKPPVDQRAQTGGADDCMTAQSKVSVTGTMARERLEEARQTNDPAKLRAAVDEALIALTSLLAATEPCRQAPAMGGMAGMDHSTMAMPQPGAPVSPRPPAAAADPHAGMTMPAAPAKPAAKPADPHAGMNMPAAPAKRGAKPTAKPAAKPGAKPADPHAGMNMPGAPAKTPAKPAAKQAAKPDAKPADPHAGMNMAPTGGATADDPKKLTCATAVDPDDAPSTTYKGKTYYFCSAADRLRFIMNPVAYLRGPDGK